jgi:drug/metabolite transporter (DMT)-like permease
VSARFGTYLALIGAVLFWGLSFVGTKVALRFFPPFTLVFLRFGAASFFFLVFFLRRGLPSFTRGQKWKLLLIALLEPGLYFACETMGLQLTSASKASLIIALIPIAVMILARIFLGEDISIRNGVSIALSFAGIAVLVTGDPEFTLQLGGALLGDLLILGAVIIAAFYTILVRDLGKTHSALVITSVQTFFGTLFFAPFFFLELRTVPWAALGPRPIMALIYLILFATILAFLCYNHALTRIPASRVAVFINGIPVVTTLAAWPVLGERLGPVQLLGGGLVLFGVYLANMRAAAGAMQTRVEG